jgi:hypothetical protein
MNGYAAQMRFGFLRTSLIFALLVLSFLISVGGERRYSDSSSQSIESVRLLLDARNSKRQQVGALTFLAAWELRSANSAFGGISAMAALGNDRFIALSDAGTLIGFTLTDKPRLKESFIAALPGAAGEDISYKDRDTEGMAYDPASGRFWVSYEAHHAIRRFNPSLSRNDGTVRLGFAKKWRENGGVEAIVRLGDGSFAIFSETHKRGDGSNSAYLYSGDPVEEGTQRIEFGYHAPTGYHPTDAALLSDGRILMLNRKISFPYGFTAKLSILDPRDIEKGKAVTTKVIATLAPPLLVDNMEGLAITQKGGRTIVWMMSDDNFSGWQRTLLMKFALNLPKEKPEADAAPGFDSL